MSKTQATTRATDFMFMRLLPVIGRLHLQPVSFQPAFMVFKFQPPNGSPEPTAAGAGRSALAVGVASWRWLSFLLYVA